MVHCQYRSHIGQHLFVSKGKISTNYPELTHLIIHAWVILLRLLGRPWIISQNRLFWYQIYRLSSRYDLLVGLKFSILSQTDRINQWSNITHVSLPIYNRILRLGLFLELIKNAHNMGHHQWIVRIYVGLWRLRLYSFCLFDSVSLLACLWRSPRWIELFFLFGKLGSFLCRILHFQDFKFAEKSVQNWSYSRDMGKETLNCWRKAVDIRILGKRKAYELHWRFDYGICLLFAMWTANRRILLSDLFDHITDPPSFQRRCKMRIKISAIMGRV